ncbi:hypothetical protein [Paraburkholderia phenazinium]|nr:hypothetical protein [Paraburkholderia phenazinium]
MKVRWRTVFQEIKYQLLPFLIMGGVVSIYLGKDWNWDLRNYHFYNPWALTHHRWGVDLFPAQLQTFLNPLSDLFFYKLADSGRPDYIVVFLMGLPAGIAAYFLWRLLANLDQVDAQNPTLTGFGFRVGACVVGMTGAAGLGQIGSTTGEWTVSSLIIGAVLALTLWQKSRLSARAAMVTAGLAIGAATALKLTAAVPAISLTIALPFLLVGTDKKQLWRLIAAYALAGLVSFGILAGPWMWKMYSNFHNPIFPYFNGLFRSPLISGASGMDVRFIPHDVRHLLAFPGYSALVGNSLRSELNLRDPRLLVGAFIAVGWIVGTVVRLVLRRPQSRMWNLKLFFAVSYVVMYLIWSELFAIYRYAIVLELLGAVMLFTALQDVCRQHRQETGVTIAGLVFLSLALLTSVPDWGRIPLDGSPYFRNKLPQLPYDSLIISTTNEPVGYLVPQWPDHPAFFSAISNLSTPSYNVKLQQIIAQRVADHKGPVYVLRDSREMSDDVRRLYELDQIKVDDSSCIPIEPPAPTNLEVCQAHPNKTPAVN